MCALNLNVFLKIYTYKYVNIIHFYCIIRQKNLKMLKNQPTKKKNKYIINEIFHELDCSLYTDMKLF